jgi:hypothetical protein
LIQIYTNTDYCLVPFCTCSRNHQWNNLEGKLFVQYYLTCIGSYPYQPQIDQGRQALDQLNAALQNAKASDRSGTCTKVTDGHVCTAAAAAAAPADLLLLLSLLLLLLLLLSLMLLPAPV